MAKRIKKIRPTRINEYYSNLGIELEGSFEALYEEVDLPMQASEAVIMCIETIVLSQDRKLMKGEK